MQIVNLIDQLPRARPWARRQLSRITRIVIHHSAARAAVDPVRQLLAFARHHIAQGWRGLAYHFAIAPDGTVYKCTELRDLTSHARGANADGVGILIMGDFDQHGYARGALVPSVPTPAQLARARELVRQLRQAEPSITRLVGHREVRGSRTACPGRYFTRAMLDVIWG